MFASKSVRRFLLALLLVATVLIFATILRAPFDVPPAIILPALAVAAGFVLLARKK